MHLTTFHASLKHATSLLVMLALLVSVAYSGQGVVLAKPAPKAAPEVVTQDIVSAAVPSEAEQTDGKMAPDKKPCTATSVLVATLVGAVSNDGARVYSQPLFDGHRVIMHETQPYQGRLPHTVAMISSSLGRQFTLVGAKPDGTM